MLTPKEGSALAHAPAVPVKGDTKVYTRFGASFEPFEYTDWIDESMSWKTSCYIGDWSPLAKLHVQGPDALRFFSDIAVNSFAKFDIGQAKHIILCNGRGKLMGEGVLMRLAEEEFLFTSGPGVLWADCMFGRKPYRATATQVGPERFILQVQGPSALFVMEAATGTPLRDIGFMRFRPASIQGCDFLVLRQGMAGEIGYEMHGRIEDATAIYNAILEAGKPFGIKRLGGRVKMVNHVEACFPTPTVDYVPAMFGDDERDFFEGYVLQRAPGFRNLIRHSGSYPVPDLSALYRTPVEMGWQKNIKFDHDFIGRAALEREVAQPGRTMRTLVWHSDDVVEVYAALFKQGALPAFMELPRGLLGGFECDRIQIDGRLVGATSSRCYSVYLRKMISLCVIDAGHAEPGTEVVVVWGGAGHAQREVRAVVAPAPLKPDQRRIDVGSLPSYLPQRGAG